MTDDLAEKALAVVQAARAWARSDWSLPGDAEAKALASAVGALEALLPANQPTGLIVDRPWGEIPAGWFVKAPNGQWYEVTSTHLDRAAGKQMVGMLGKLWSRDPAAKVPTRRGSLHPEADTALDALGGAFTVDVLDDPPWEA